MKTTLNVYIHRLYVSKLTLLLLLLLLFYLGSTADLSEVHKEDVLLSLDGINLGVNWISRLSPSVDLISSKSPITSLNQLEKLMDRLVLETRNVPLIVLRKPDNDFCMFN